ncbi:MAG: hypothetical protein E7528_04145 [Ruminococcaceae bacterium]|nr:hypothetical protein [Oscillospiraceae bacterium]
MKKILKSSFAFMLVFAIITSTLTCFAIELNQDAVNEHRGQFENYLLLGDSVASGYRDVMCDEDDAYNKTYQETVYCRVPGSYADVLTKAIIEDDTMTAFAAPGYRTVEIRYMLEDDFDEADDYMFHPAQLNAVGDAGSEEYRTAYKKAVAEADLITLGVGGNDWGAYLGWVVSDVFEKENVADEYAEQLQGIIEGGTMDVETIKSLVEIVHLAGALPELVATLPSALSDGLSNFYKNWDIMIQDIYDLNPDVTLMVLGMSDNSVKGKYYSYNGEEGEPISTDAVTQSEVVTTIVDFIMTVGNTPMIEGAEKFGYTYVDTAGTTYVESHPDADGHVYIANKIIEALLSVNSSDDENADTSGNDTDGEVVGGDNNENANPPTQDNENNTENDSVNNNEKNPDTDIDKAVIVAPVVAIALASLTMMIIIFAKRKRIEE